MSREVVVRMTQEHADKLTKFLGSLKVEGLIKNETAPFLVRLHMALARNQEGHSDPLVKLGVHHTDINMCGEPL